MAKERDFGERLAAIARELVHEPDMQHTLQRIVELAAADLDGEVYASVSLVGRRQQVDTAAASDERAARADQLQYELGEGPCLDAIWAQDTVQIDDMTTEHRYPAWLWRVAEEIGIRSSLSLQLFTNEDSLGALNLYAPQPRGFDAETRGAGLAFAAQAAVVLRSAQNEQHLRRDGDAHPHRSGPGHPHGAVQDDRRAGLRGPVPGLPADQRQAPRRGPAPDRHRRNPRR